MVTNFEVLAKKYPNEIIRAISSYDHIAINKNNHEIMLCHDDDTDCSDCIFSLKNNKSGQNCCEQTRREWLLSPAEFENLSSDTRNSNGEITW